MRLTRLKINCFAAIIITVGLVYVIERVYYYILTSRHCDSHRAVQLTVFRRQHYNSFGKTMGKQSISHNTLHVLP